MFFLQLIPLSNKELHRQLITSLPRQYYDLHLM